MLMLPSTGDAPPDAVRDEASSDRRVSDARRALKGTMISVGYESNRGRSRERQPKSAPYENREASFAEGELVVCDDFDELHTCDAIRDKANEAFVSIVSVWQAVVKREIGKLPLPAQADDSSKSRREAHRIAGT